MKGIMFLLSLIVALPGVAFGDDMAMSPRASRGDSRTSVSGRATTNAISRGGQRATVSRSSGAVPGVVSRRNAVSETNAARATTTTTTYMAASGGAHTSDSGRVSLRTTPIVGGRMAPAASSARAPSITTVSVSNNAATVVSDSVANVTANLESLAELTDYCKAQYDECMDNFCNVLDDNQGRCTCSKNVKNYEKSEDALRAAAEELQDVAQRIQYIGLTADEINTLFTQTEAEMAMQNTTDTSKIKNDLDRVRNMLVGVKTGSSSASVTENSGISIDFSNLLSFNIDSYGFDLSGLFGTSNTTNTQSIGNQRGEALYKSASSRCKQAVLSNCTAQGVDAAVIVNAYDMEIDKQCIRYERALTDSNNQMIATVRNAKTVLQKARLMVAQQKNQYDLRGCISALDSCMQDDYVCGNDYEECLDPTGKYIVEGSVVVGSMPGESGGEWDETKKKAQNGLYTVWNVGGTGNQNIWAPGTASQQNSYTITSYIGATLKLDSAKTAAPKDISEFLQTKIGYHDDKTGRNYGMCMSVLNKCQDYTYDRNGKYVANNQIISEYMQRAFRQIKTSQDRILASYAQNCLSDVNACLSQNNYGFGASTSGSNNYSDIAIRACLPVINTCRSVTLGLSEADVQPGNFADIYVWLDAGIGTSYQSVCESSGGIWQAKDSSPFAGTCKCTSSGESDTDVLPEGLKLSTDKKYCVCADSTKEWKDGACVAKQ